MRWVAAAVVALVIWAKNRKTSSFEPDPNDDAIEADYIELEPASEDDDTPDWAHEAASIGGRKATSLGLLGLWPDLTTEQQDSLTEWLGFHFGDVDLPVTREKLKGAGPAVAGKLWPELYKYELDGVPLTSWAAFVATGLAEAYGETPAFWYKATVPLELSLFGNLS